MQSRYQVILYNTSGVRVAIFDDWRAMLLERKVSDFDLLTFSLDSRDPRVSLFTLDAIIEVWRKPSFSGSVWVRESTLLHRTGMYQVTEGDHYIFTSYARGLEDFIRRREILYPANTSYTLKGGAADTVIAEYVDENAGPSADATIAPDVYARKRAGHIAGLTVSTAAGAAPSWAGQRSYQNLLTVIQEIGNLNSVDFDIQRTGYSGTAFVFTTYYPQLGTDRSASVSFAPNLANMLAPTYTKSRTEECTVVIALGQGQESSRRTIIAESAATADSPWNDIEFSKDARNESTVQGLTDAAEEELIKLEAKENFEFQVLQTATSIYGRNYFLGDIVTAYMSGITVTKKIVGVSMGFSQGKESLGITFADTTR